MKVTREARLCGKLTSQKTEDGARVEVKLKHYMWEPLDQPKLYFKHCDKLVRQRESAGPFFLITRHPYNLFHHRKPDLKCHGNTNKSLLP